MDGKEGKGGKAFELNGLKKKNSFGYILGSSVVAICWDIDKTQN